MVLNLDISTRGYLTRTVLTPNPNGTGDPIVNAFLCDLDGNALTSGAVPLPIYPDIVTGKTFVRVAENIPTGPGLADVSEALRLHNLNPTHYVSADGHVKGYFIEAPDFNNRDGVPLATPVALHPVVLVEAEKSTVLSPVLPSSALLVHTTPVALTESEEKGSV